MPVYDVRVFDDDASIVAIGEGLLAATLPRAQWTHKAHLAACTWILRHCPDIDPTTDMAGIISGYNLAVGGVNDDSQGYHETITQVYITAVSAHLAEISPNVPLRDAVNRLLLSERGRRDLPLRFYSKELLFSVQARRTFMAPDLASLDLI